MVRADRKRRESAEKAPGKEYERIVAEIHRQFADGVTVTEDEKILGKSGEERQIDVVLRGRVSVYPVIIIVDCKDYKRKVGIQRVDEMIGKIDDVRASAGIIVSDSGFSKKAIARARKDGRVQLSSVVNVKNQRLRARPLVPFVCDFRRPRMRLEVRGSSRIGFAIDPRLETETYNRFMEMWNAGELSDALGEHSLVEVLHDTPDLLVEVEYFYEVQRRLFFKRLPLEEGTGIYDAVTGSFSTRGFKLAAIDFMDVEANWQKVSDDAIPQATFHFVALDMFPTKLWGEAYSRGSAPAR
jgi:hypothetical protein